MLRRMLPRPGRALASACSLIAIHCAALVGLAVVGCGDRVSEESPANPVEVENEAPRNLLLVTLDTVRADYVGSYIDGEPDAIRRNITPNLDRLAESGVRFARAISSASVTPVSHASILTGQFPYRHGLRVLSADGSFRVNNDVPLLAEVLQGAGYRTGAIHGSFTV